ncbi:MAG: DNA-3-methyladenine glycosylase I, partial [Bryocella sp.]
MQITRNPKSKSALETIVSQTHRRLRHNRFMANGKVRCGWAAKSDALMQQYHDEEWGVPEHDSRALWELLMLEGFQAG